MGRRHVLQGIQGFFRLAFLINAHNGVQNHNQNDKRGLKKLAPVLLHTDHHKGNDGGGDENQDHDVLELIHKALKIGLFLLFFQFIGTVFFLQFGDALRRQSPFAVGSVSV